MYKHWDCAKRKQRTYLILTYKYKRALTQPEANLYLQKGIDPSYELSSNANIKPVS